MTSASEDQGDLGAAIEGLRAQGAHRLDPVRFRHVEALVRRAAAHRGETRRLLDAQLARLLTACDHAVEQARSASATRPDQAPQQDALTALLAHVARHAAPPGELKTVRNGRSTWSRLRVDQQMTRALAKVPDNAGPLNTQRLLHQALTAMRDASPEYAHQFMAHVEALLWLDQASLAGSGTTKGPGRNTPKNTLKRESRT
jgi:hypothetical protein